MPDELIKPLFFLYLFFLLYFGRKWRPKAKQRSGTANHVDYGRGENRARYLEIERQYKAAPPRRPSSQAGATGKSKR